MVELNLAMEALRKAKMREKKKYLFYITTIIMYIYTVL